MHRKQRLWGKIAINQSSAATCLLTLLLLFLDLSEDNTTIMKSKDRDKSTGRVMVVSLNVHG